MKLRSKCCGAEVVPHPQEYVCSNCGLSCIPIKRGMKIKVKVTEEWIEEKAKELLDKTSDKDFSYSVRLGNAEDFIRSLVEANNRVV